MTDLQAKSEQLLAAIEREGVALELSAFLVRDEPMPFSAAVGAGHAEAPSMIALRRSSEPAFVFRQAELRIHDPAARKVALDFKVLHELMTSLPDGDRRTELTDALDRFARSDDDAELEMAF